MALPIVLLYGCIRLFFLFSVYLVYFYEGSEGFGMVILGVRGRAKKNFRLAIACHDSCPCTTDLIFTLQLSDMIRYSSLTWTQKLSVIS